MKPLSSALAAHLDSEVTTLATCWKVIRVDGQTFFFTDHDRDLTVDGDVYLAATGYTRSAIASTADLAVGNLDVEAILDAATITEADLRAGRFDRAAIELFLVNWADPAAGRITLRKGWLGEVELANAGGYRAELRGLAQALTTQIIRVYTPDCDADLGDARCGVDLALLTETGTVTAVALPTRRFTAAISGSRPAGFFDGGLLTWTSGANAEHPPIEVKSEASGEVTLFLPTNFPVQVDDAFSITAGCDKSKDTCQGKFANIANFRGFPFVPGLDAALQTPNAL
jgi:uncharacterized phage protein (TIGR02218 family)